MASETLDFETQEISNLDVRVDEAWRAILSKHKNEIESASAEPEPVDWVSQPEDIKQLAEDRHVKELWQSLQKGRHHHAALGHHRLLTNSQATGKQMRLLEVRIVVDEYTPQPETLELGKAIWDIGDIEVTDGKPNRKFRMKTGTATKGAYIFWAIKPPQA